MNYFASYTAAERYAFGRPDFHGNSINHIKNFLEMENKFNQALDIACGTGLSTQALLEIANTVYGTDSAQAMLDHAIQKDKIHYQIAKAEEQPFRDSAFDLITVCSGVHWFDIEKFLIEANRLLMQGAHLVLYDNFFGGEMKDNPNFNKWYTTVYLEKFPPPKRNDAYKWTEESLSKSNLNLVKEERFYNVVMFTINTLILYFTTQSNIISKVEENETTFGKVEIWLKHQLVLFFENETETHSFIFGNWIKYIRKI